MFVFTNSSVHLLIVKLGAVNLQGARKIGKLLKTSIIAAVYTLSFRVEIPEPQRGRFVGC